MNASTMTSTPFVKNDLMAARERYKQHAKGLSARTIDEESFWDEEVRMLSEFPEIFQSAGYIPERNHLKGLTKWKWAGLWANHAQDNTRKELQSITKQAYGITSDSEVPSAQDIRRQIQVLKRLKGISTATATVLLTFWKPTVYTVMDQRALASLTSADFWTGKAEANIEDYPRYLKKVHLIAEDTGLILRDTDRALWYLGE